MATGRCCQLTSRRADDPRTGMLNNTFNSCLLFPCIRVPKMFFIEVRILLRVPSSNFWNNKNVRFQQTHNQGLGQFFLTVSWDLRGLDRGSPDSVLDTLQF